ncbi:hypothetical protein [Nocardia sp. NPDC004604]|uniref:hypothetical protein n=1 Tax=Nocardia sp. NPDC004604 TaxID=3157013 RepID=UPI0033B490E4
MAATLVPDQHRESALNRRNKKSVDNSRPVDNSAAETRISDRQQARRHHFRIGRIEQQSAALRASAGTGAQHHSSDEMADVPQADDLTVAKVVILPKFRDTPGGGMKPCVAE